MERFINILVIDDDSVSRAGLKEILVGSGNNVLLSKSFETALSIVQQKEVGIILINIDSPFFSGLNLLKQLKKESKIANIYCIVLTESSKSGAKMVKGLNYGAVDFITKPFDPNLVQAKIEVYKSLFYKDQRIGQLLSNIFPPHILEDFNKYGKTSPKRIENAVVLFTDFVDFSAKAKDLKPLELLEKLEKHFTAIDRIIQRYQLEKIKTIGDAYMALAGSTEGYPRPAVRACLAALEIQNYIWNEQQVAKAFNKDYWEIRIGIHMGPLVAGIIGTTKYNYDIWGDTVNIAARTERSSEPGKINITDAVYKRIKDYFEVTARGKIKILKRGGKLNMYFLEQLENPNSLYEKGIIASSKMRKLCGLPSIDFTHMRIDIINRLKALLPEDLVYHDISHTLSVEKSIIRFAELEGLDKEEIYLLRTAALYHDAGFIFEYDKNEKFAIQLAKNNLPRFGYSEEKIELICAIIKATRFNTEPKTLLEKIMCDADHDYLGRPDYNYIAKRLRQELNLFYKKMDDAEWIQFQYNYLANTHQFYTDTAKNIRQIGKENRMEELQRQLLELQQ